MGSRIGNDRDGGSRRGDNGVQEEKMMEMGFKKEDDRDGVLRGRDKSWVMLQERWDLVSKVSRKASQPLPLRIPPCQ
jgi:hypothetical protein